MVRITRVAGLVGALALLSTANGTPQVQKRQDSVSVYSYNSITAAVPTTTSCVASIDDAQSIVGTFEECDTLCEPALLTYYMCDALVTCACNLLKPSYNNTVSECLLCSAVYPSLADKYRPMVSTILNNCVGYGFTLTRFEVCSSTTPPGPSAALSSSSLATSSAVASTTSSLVISWNSVTAAVSTTTSCVSSTDAAEEIVGTYEECDALCYPALLIYYRCDSLTTCQCNLLKPEFNNTVSECLLCSTFYPPLSEKYQTMVSKILNNCVGYGFTLTKYEICSSTSVELSSLPAPSSTITSASPVTSSPVFSWNSITAAVVTTTSCVSSTDAAEEIVGTYEECDALCYPALLIYYRCDSLTTCQCNLLKPEFNNTVSECLLCSTFYPPLLEKYQTMVSKILNNCVGYGFTLTKYEVCSPTAGPSSLLAVSSPSLVPSNSFIASSSSAPSVAVPTSAPLSWNSITAAVVTTTSCVSSTAAAEAIVGTFEQCDALCEPALLIYYMCDSLTTCQCNLVKPEFNNTVSECLLCSAFYPSLAQKYEPMVSRILNNCVGHGFTLAKYEICSGASTSSSIAGSSVAVSTGSDSRQSSAFLSDISLSTGGTSGILSSSAHSAVSADVSSPTVPPSSNFLSIISVPATASSALPTMCPDARAEINSLVAALNNLAATAEESSSFLAASAVIDAMIGVIAAVQVVSPPLSECESDAVSSATVTALEALFAYLRRALQSLIKRAIDPAVDEIAPVYGELYTSLQGILECGQRVEISAAADEVYSALSAAGSTASAPGMACMSASARSTVSAALPSGPFSGLSQPTAPYTAHGRDSVMTLVATYVTTCSQCTGVHTFSGYVDQTKTVSPSTVYRATTITASNCITTTLGISSRSAVETTDTVIATAIASFPLCTDSHLAPISIVSGATYPASAEADATVVTYQKSQAAHGDDSRTTRTGILLSRTSISAVQGANPAANTADFYTGTASALSHGSISEYIATFQPSSGDATATSALTVAIGVGVSSTPALSGLAAAIIGMFLY